MACVWVVVSLALTGALRVSAVNECYGHSCLGVGCLERATATGEAGTCARTEFGCSVLLTGDLEVATCATERCDDQYTVKSGIPPLTSLCCYEDLCNNNTKPMRKPGDNCYSVTCDTKGCVAAAVDAGIAAYCAKPSGGSCFFSLAQSGEAGSHSHQESALCSTECQSLTTRTVDNFSQQTCCATPLCNDGKGVTVADDQCYSIICSRGSGEDCIKTAPSIGLTPGLCKMDPNYGCYLTVQYHGPDPPEVSVQAGCSSADRQCIPATTDQVRTKCCTSNICNDELATDQQEDRCYQFTCRGDDCSQNAIASKNYQLCDRHPEFGCLFTLIENSDPTQGSAAAVCAMSLCHPSQTTTAGGNVTVACCNTDLCNFKTDATQDPDVDQCHIAVCSGEGRTCLSRDIDVSLNPTFCRTGQYGGCSYQKMYNDGRSHVYAGCNVEPVCQSFATYVNSSTFQMLRCCHGNKCNRGPRAEITSQNQCYETMCQGSDCLKDAVQANVYLLCPMSEHGCVISSGEVADSGNTTMLMTKSACAQSKCVVGQTTELGFKATICCSKSLCLSDVTSGSNRLPVTSMYLSFVASIIIVLSCL